MKASTKELRTRRHKKVRTRVRGTEARPRLAAFKSNRYVYAQLIDDEKGVTLGSASSLKLKGKLLEKALKVGEMIGKSALDKKITKVVFDRGGFLYSGHIKAVADGARKAGLEF